MHDRTNYLNENFFSNSEQRKHGHPQWVNKYLELADTALGQEKEDQDRAA